MNNFKSLVFFILSFFLISCSFDDKTGIWGSSEEEKIRLAELEKQQNQTISRSKIYSSENIFNEEKNLLKRINLSKPLKNKKWEMSGLNYQNFLGNIYLSETKNLFLKKKIGKNKFSSLKIMSSPLAYNNNIFLTDDTGTIFSIDQKGRINWKKNIYKKKFKRFYKNLTISIYKNNIFIADNIGFIYAISSDSGKLLWIKNHGVPFKSKIKVYENKILLINQDNRILAFDVKDGSVVWSIRSISSFIKSQKLLSLALSEQGDLIVSNSSGDLIKINQTNGSVDWSLNTLGSMLAHAADFFKSSDIVIFEDIIIFSNHTSILSYDLNTGLINWEQKISCASTPIIDDENIFFVTENGYFVILSLKDGKIISSTNILKVLKKKKQITQISGFIMGNGKIYSVTLNGFLIVSSASTGKVESFIKLGDNIISNPIIYDGKLFIYSEKSRIYGFK